MAKITTKEAARKLGVTPTRIQQLILDEKLPAEKLGRDWLIEEGDLNSIQVYGKPGRPKKQSDEKQPTAKKAMKKAASSKKAGVAKAVKRGAR